jgi:hypothetical protein
MYLVCVYVSIDIGTYVCMHECMDVCVCMYGCMCACLCTYYVCMHVRMCELCVFRVVLATNTNYFAIQHYSVALYAVSTLCCLRISFSLRLLCNKRVA